MMKKEKVLLSVGLVCLSILFGASSAMAQMGVTDTEIKIGSILDLSGPAATAGVALRKGHKVLIDYVNSQGGVHGRKIKYIVEDDKYSPPQTVAAAKKLVTRDEIFCMFNNTGTAHAESISRFITKNKVPLLFPATAAYKVTHPPKKYVFGIYSNYESEAKLHADYIANIVKNPKVFVQRFDTDFGKNTSLSLQEQLGHYGIKIVGEATHKYSTKDFSSHVLKAKQAGANVMPIYSLGPPTAKIAVECKKLNYQPLFILFSSSSVDEILDLAGSVLEDCVGTKINALNTNPHPEIQKYIKLMKAAGHQATQVQQSGYFSARTVIMALQQTGRDLTTDNLIKTLESWKDYDAVAFAPLTYGPNRRQGPNGALWWTVKNKAWEYLVPGWHQYKEF
ncbi:ABC transporter substrate-binding protein [Thermodesulfobacteriota bacterium]